MKTIFRTLLILVSSMLVFMSCETKNEQELKDGWYISVATINKSADGDFYLTKDDSTTIFPKNLSEVYNMNDSLIGKRAWFEYRLYIEAFEEPNYDQTAKMALFRPTVWIKEPAEAENEDEFNEIGDDLVSIQKAWVSGKCLNFDYAFYGQNPDKHDFNLVKKNYAATSDGKIKLGFTHKSSETSTNKTRTISSFDISDFIPAESGKKQVIQVSFKYSNNSPEATFEIELKKDSNEEVSISDKELAL